LGPYPFPPSSPSPVPSHCRSVLLFITAFFMPFRRLLNVIAGPFPHSFPKCPQEVCLRGSSPHDSFLTGCSPVCRFFLFYCQGRPDSFLRFIGRTVIPKTLRPSDLLRFVLASQSFSRPLFPQGQEFRPCHHSPVEWFSSLHFSHPLFPLPCFDFLNFFLSLVSCPFWPQT